MSATLTQDGLLSQIRELLLDHADEAIFVHGAGDGTFAACYLEAALLSHGFACLPYTRQTLLAQARRSKPGILFVVNETGIVLAETTRASPANSAMLSSPSRAIRHHLSRILRRFLSSSVPTSRSPKATSPISSVRER
jgi:hypothetical protein